MVKRIFGLAQVLALVGCNAILGIEHGQPKPGANDSGAADSGEPDTGPDARATDGDTDGADSSVEASDASSDTTVDAADAPACASVRWPAPPDRDDPGGSNTIEVEVATETMTLDIGPDLGFDLDGRCTCPEAPSCVSTARPDMQCDQSGGRDVMANTLVPVWASLGLTALSTPSLLSDLHVGRAGTLLRVHNYNGLANDKLVVVEFFGKAWIPPVGGVYQPTKRDGSDTWSVYRDSIVGVSTAVEQDIAAYVNDNVLVAKLRTATIALRPNTGTVDNPLVVELRDAMLVGTLVPTDRGFRLDDAKLDGRWPAHKALLSFGALSDAGGFICGNHPFFAPLRSQVCESLDIASARADDNSGSTCDAISLAIGFSAGPAHVGTALDPPMVVPSCPAGWAPNCNVP